jgi:hypothetical protein
MSRGQCWEGEAPAEPFFNYPTTSWLGGSLALPFYLELFA